MNVIFTYKFDDTKLATLEGNLQLAFPDYKNIEVGMELSCFHAVSTNPTLLLSLILINQFIQFIKSPVHSD